MRALQTENRVPPVTNNDGPESADVFMTESENEGDALIVEDRAVAGHIEKEIEMQALSTGDETARRRERRQAQALRVREGNRRKKEGRPRNYLLVDDYTGKPYGTGVGEWRKELMLLSRELDPAVGNINQQPEGVLLEIAEWIQHTWEYSAPVKFKFVKEVIARGVTLRRGDLFKMIKNKEPKPENLSDRSWRILGRLLESETTIRKSENCSRANASRAHFGRTGPSGEVGVRERLKRKLRRSLELEEISKEMARDKGYGGHSKRKSCADRVMHGSESGLRRPFQETTMNLLSVSADEEDDKENGEQDGGAYALEVDKHDCVEMGDDNRGGLGLNLSSEEIMHHPFVMKMMKRLEALEGREKARAKSVPGTEEVVAAEVPKDAPTVVEGRNVVAPEQVCPAIVNLIVLMKNVAANLLKWSMQRMLI